MKHRIIESNLKSFLDDFGIQERNEDVQFEHFANYCVFSQEDSSLYQQDLDSYQSVHTGMSGDGAIDGVLISVNDITLHDESEFREIGEKMHSLSVKYSFVQAKNQTSIDSGDLMKFCAGVKDFFTGSSRALGEKIKRKRKLANVILDEATKFKANPALHLSFVYLGDYCHDPYISETINEWKTQFKAMRLFDDIRIDIVDATALQQRWRQISLVNEKTIKIVRAQSFPEIQGITDAYLGLIDGKSFIDLITDDRGNINRLLFYDNVRNYLGNKNQVNKSICATIADEAQRYRFPLLNNGVTIITRELRVSGERFVLTGYQIVNGCQTSHVLYEERDKVDENLFIPVKIINVNDRDVINSIIKSTNSQTQVTDEALESLRDFHKKLQDYYNTFPAESRLYYERRVNEYSNLTDSRVQRKRIISIPIQLLAFNAMFVEEPHSNHRYYGELLTASRGKIFVDSHRLAPYYASALCLIYADSLRAIVTDRKQRDAIAPYRYHFLLILRCLLLSKVTREPLNSRAVERDALAIISSVQSSRFKDTFIRAIDILTKSIKDACNSMQGTDLERNPLYKHREFTRILKVTIEEYLSTIR